MPRAKKSETAATETTASMSAALKAQPAEEPKAAVPEKKTAARKPAAKKTAEPKAAKEPQVSVVLEYGGKQIVPKELVAKAMENFKAAHDDVEVESLKLYINAEENCAYLVVNGEEYPEDKIEF